MKRAEVYRDRRYPGYRPQWITTVHEGDIPERDRHIWDRESATGEDDYFPTYAEALMHAIRAVSLAPCECWPVPEKYHTTHYGATDPATTHQWNPDCPAHSDPIPEVDLASKEKP